MNLVLFVLMLKFLYINFYFSKPKRVATSKFAFIAKNNFEMHMFKESKCALLNHHFQLIRIINREVTYFGI